MAYIELLGNPMAVNERNEFKATIKEHNIQTFWSWEHKILLQEQQYFQA